ncbi:MAG: RNA polymerase sigma factor [Ruminococcaceae bacterium]|nr:RNA polymerase sigma factor [Oscillospiraceae bacterium]
MEDKRIVALFLERDEQALTEARRVYHRYLTRIAQNVLHNPQDTEECVNDTYLRAWNAIPPHQPKRLSVFLGKITRRLALDRYTALTAQKRGGGTTPALLEEWRDALPGEEGDPTDDLAIREALNRFLRQLPTEKRRVFIRRYWYGDPIPTIATDHHATESRIKMMLARTRGELKTFLEKEGISL